MRSQSAMGARGAACAAAAAALLATAAGAAEDPSFCQTVTFRKGLVEVRGLLRFRSQDDIRITQLLLATPEGKLLSSEDKLWLEPVVSGRARVAVAEPRWWMEVWTSHPELKADSFPAAIDALAAGDPEIINVVTSDGPLGSGRFEVAEDQNRGEILALRELVTDGEAEEAVPAEAVPLLLLLEEIAGPHEALPQGWDYAVGWKVGGLVGPILRRRLSGDRSPERWEAVAGPRVQQQSLGSEERLFLQRFEAAGLVE